MIRAKVVRVGNSRGIRIPKPLLDQCGIEGPVELSVRNGSLLVRPLKPRRQGWEKAFRRMAERKDDAVLDPGVSGTSEWDRNEWVW